ncbi:hypothetical protein JD844_021534, partial [Phrynosoma platyrhinos]
GISFFFALASGVSNARSQVLGSTSHSRMKRDKRLSSEKQFVFKAPEEVVRKAPEPKIIEKQGLYEISMLPSGVSRCDVCLHESKWWHIQQYVHEDAQTVVHAAGQWHPLLTMLKDRIEDFTKNTFNSLLCNLYRNEKDSVDWHSDDEPALGQNPVIASLSFGATRMFEMRKKPLPVSMMAFLYFRAVNDPSYERCLWV